MEDEIFFLHPENRRFVAGRRRRNAQWSHCVDRLCLTMFFALIVGAMFVIQFGYGYEPETAKRNFWGGMGLLFILLVKGSEDYAQARKHADLSRNGQILRGEITGADEDKHSEYGEHWTIEFCFASPISGAKISASESGSGTDKKPPREIQVLFLDDKTFCAL